MLGFFRALALFGLVVLFGYTSGQQAKADIVHRRLTSDNGLPTVGVYDIHQDQEGYIWITTADGAWRYNGQRFEQHLRFPEVFPNVIYAIHELGPDSFLFRSDSELWFLVDGKPRAHPVNQLVSELSDRSHSIEWIFRCIQRKCEVLISNPSSQMER